MILYETMNLINNKFYIGMDSKNNPKYLGSGKILTRAIKKYGKDNFKKIILEKCSTFEELCEREIYWIGKLKPPYNIAKGGTGGHTMKNATKEQIDKYREKLRKANTGKIRSNETKKKISEAKKGIKFTEEHISLLRKSHKGQIPWNKGLTKETDERLDIQGQRIREVLTGRTLSIEVKNKMSKSHTGKIMCNETKIKIGNSNRKPRPNRRGENHSNFKIFQNDAIDLIKVL